MPEPKLSVAEFSAKVKLKYPQYKDVDDSVLVSKMLDKYPVYSEQVDFDVKKKELSEASDLQSLAEPSASATSNKVPAAFGEIPKFEGSNQEDVSEVDTPNWYNVAKSALGQTYEIGKSALLKAASYASPLSTPLTREAIDVQAKSAIDKIRDEGPKFEQTFTESIAQGKFGDAALQAEEFLLGTAPLAITSAAITLGTGGLGAPVSLALMGGYGAQSAHLDAKGEKFYEDMSPLMRAGYTGAMGGLEVLGEGIGGKILSGAVKKLAAQQITKQAFEQTAKEIAKGALKSNGVAVTEEALAEFTTGFGQSAVDQYARTGDVNLGDAFRQGFEGAAMGAVGGAVFNTPSTIADATALANSVGRDMKNAKARTEINKYKEKLDASSTVEEQDYYAQKLAESIKTRTRNATDDAKFYEYVGTQNPQDLEQFLEIDNEIKRYASMAKVIKDPEATKDIKAKVEGLIQQQKDLESKYSAYDTQKEAGIPSPVVEGEAPIEVQPIEGAGQEAPEAGGVLQVPIEEGTQVVDKPKENIKPQEVTVEGDDLILRHGSPYQFDKFLLENVGTGEGNQAFGYGLYFTESSGIANSYAKKLSDDKTGLLYTVKIKGGNTSNWLPWREPVTDGYFDKVQLTPEEQAQYQEYLNKERDDYPIYFEAFKDVSEGAEYFAGSIEAENVPNSAVYNDLADALGKEKATEILKRSGYSGIVYNSKKGYGEAKNYVVFDPESIEIIETSTSKVVKPTAEVTAPIEATVFAAPFYDTKVNNIEEARAIRQTEAYVTNLDTIRNASALFNVEIDGIDESIGGFVNEAGDKIVEVSNIIRVKGTPEDVQNYAAFLATSSPETQEATIAATYVEQNSEMHNIDELTISVSDIDGAIEALKENDIYDFTINDSNNTITFLDFSKGEDVEFKKKIGRFAKSLDAKNITNEEQDIRAIESKYIGPSERTRILGQVQETLVQQGQTGTELYRQVEQAIARNQEFIAKTAAPITEAEPESIIEPVSDSEAANFVKPEPGKSLDDIYKSYEESIKPVITPKTVLQSIKKKTIDRQSKLKNAVLEIGLRNAYDRIVNKSGASARANDKYRRAEKKIYRKLSDEEIKTLDKIIFARRVIQIDQNFDARGVKRPKHPLGYSLEKANFNLAELKNKLGEEKYNDLIKRSDTYFEEFRSTLKDLYDAGLISEDTYENLRTNNYQPRKFIEHVYDFNNAKFLLKDNGLTDNQIKAIKEGSDKELIMNSRFLLSSYLLSASNRILSNRTNKALSKAIEKNKATEQWIRPLEEGDDVDSGFSKVLYLENGEQRQFQLRADLKAELDNVSLNLGDNANLISIVLGVPLIKLMATGANPIFAVKNVFRDFGHVLFFTNVYDKHNLYYATALLIRDYHRGLKSSMRQDQDFIDYMDLGGGMSFLASQGRDGNFAKKTLKDKALDLLGKPGEYSEIAMRISVYRKFKEEGILKFEQKNGTKPTGEDLLNIKESAVAKAREIIDFQQGGELVKNLDKFIPYLNAAFQGFRVGATYVANNPKTFGNKLVQAQLGLLILAFFNKWGSDDEDMQNIPEHTRLMNFIIFIPFSKRIDEDGVERKAFIKIPKTQQAAPFFALMDVANRKIINDIFGKEYEVSENEYNFIVNGLKKSLPIGLSSALGIVDIASRKALGGAKDEKIENEAFRDFMQTVPLINSIGTYMSNYDAFRDRMIAIDKDKLLPSFEGVSDPDVEKFYKVLGETTGMSPIRTKAATEKLITGPQSSLVVGAAYGLLDAMVNSYDLDKGEYNLDVIKSDNNNFFKNTGLNVKKSLIAETDPKWKMYSRKETLDNIDMEAGTERARLRNKAKELSVGTNNPGQLEKSTEEARKIANEIAKKNPIDAKYFFNSFKANIGESPASPESIEIQYSASDKARAEKIKFLFNPQSEEEFLNIRKDVYDQTGYKINSKTIYEYEKEYGKLK